MAWYLVSGLVGLVIGLIISRFLPAMIQFKGKIKQKGKGNSLTVKPNIEVKKQPRKRLIRRNKKEHRN